MSCPPTDNVQGVSVSAPDGGYNPSSKEAIVDFPEPEEPTMAVQVFGGMVRLRFCKMIVSGREGYLKERFLNSILPALAIRMLPACSCDLR